MAKPLDIYARLNISIAGKPLNIRAAHSLITIELPNLQAARALFKTGRSRSERRKFLGAVMAMLAQGDLQLEVWVSNWRVARLGVGSRLCTSRP